MSDGLVEVTSKAVNRFEEIMKGLMENENLRCVNCIHEEGDFDNAGLNREPNPVESTLADLTEFHRERLEGSEIGPNGIVGDEYWSIYDFAAEDVPAGLRVTVPHLRQHEDPYPDQLGNFLLGTFHGMSSQPVQTNPGYDISLFDLYNEELESYLERDPVSISGMPSSGPVTVSVEMDHSVDDIGDLLDDIYGIFCRVHDLVAEREDLSYTSTLQAYGLKDK